MPGDLFLLFIPINTVRKKEEKNSEENVSSFLYFEYREQVLTEEKEKEQKENEEEASNEDSNKKKKKAMGRKSEEVIARIVEGKVKKRLSEMCLLQQNHMIEGKDAPEIKKHIESISKEVNHRLKITEMILWSVGDGNEEEESL